MARKLPKLQCVDCASRNLTIHVAMSVYWCGEFGGDVGNERAGVVEGVMGMVGLMLIVGGCVVRGRVAVAVLLGRRLIALRLCVGWRVGSTPPHRLVATVVVVVRISTTVSKGGPR